MERNKEGEPVRSSLCRLPSVGSASSKEALVNRPTTRLPPHSVVASAYLLMVAPSPERPEGVFRQSTTKLGGLVSYSPEGYFNQPT